MAEYKLLNHELDSMTPQADLAALLETSVVTPKTSLSHPSGTLYIGTHGHVVAFDIRNARQAPKRLWKVNLVGTGYGPASVLYEAGSLYAACGGSVFRINAEDGKVIWKSNASSWWFMLTLVSKGHILIAGAGTNVAAFIKETGQLVWRADLGLLNNGATNMALVENVLYVGSFGSLFALDVMTGKKLWSDGLSGRGFSPMTLMSGSSSQGQPTLYVGCNGYITSFIASKDYHKEVKCVNLGGFTCVSSLLHNDSLILGNMGAVTCVDSATLETKWSNKLSGTGYGFGTSIGIVNVQGKPMLLAGNHGYLTAVNPEDGKTIWSISLPGSGFRIVTFFEQDGVLFVGSRGMLYGLGVDGKGLWSDNLEGMGYGNMLFSTGLTSTDTNGAQPIIQEEALMRQTGASKGCG